MTLQVGSKLPDCEVVIWDQNQRMAVRLSDVLKGKEISCIITVPGAFTPVCSGIHLPSFVNQKEALEKMACQVVCISTDKIPSLEAWKKSFSNSDHITMVSDCHHHFGRETDLLVNGNPTLGTVLKRSSIVVHNGTVEKVNIEANAANCAISHADETIKDIQFIYNARVKKDENEEKGRHLVAYPPILPEGPFERDAHIESLTSEESISAHSEEHSLNDVSLNIDHPLDQ